jgi:hypothetical protein
MEPAPKRDLASSPWEVSNRVAGQANSVDCCTSQPLGPPRLATASFEPLSPHIYALQTKLATPFTPISLQLAARPATNDNDKQPLLAFGRTKISGSNPTLTTASTPPFLPVLSPQVETATAGRFLGDQLRHAAAARRR